MFNNISITTQYVLDQAEAIDFYVGKLGFEVRNDVDLGFMRWLTIGLPSDPDREILLEVPGPPAHSDEVATQARDLITKGAMGSLILTTDDCQATYDNLVAQGVESTEEPTEQPYGIDCAFRDPFGNPFRITQPAEQVAEITNEDKTRWGGGD
ncbi:MAG: VOC family protein [Acidimicrobiia bacterium]|nr:VOC family protein [Acidimicrobiia bacterium]